jgi:diguanylate cyclase (GGDEF)-like protein
MAYLSSHERISLGTNHVELPQKNSAKMTHESLLGSQRKIWKSPLSWKITMVVFATILTIQIFMFALTVNQREHEILQNIQSTAQAAVVQTISLDGEVPGTDLVSPITEDEWLQLSQTTPITGLSIYNQDFDLLASYGDPCVIKLTQPGDVAQTHWGEDGSFYEFILRPFELGSQPYNIVMRVASENIRHEKINYARQSLTALFSTTLFVTFVLMIALGRWLLEPILLLRHNLIAARNNMENPELLEPVYKDRDEITETIQAAHSLIEQNSNNLKKMKHQAAQQMHNLAYYDQLTALPNRANFVGQLSEFARADDGQLQSSKRAAIVAIDLDQFKDINDSMGHKVGDAILRAVGKRLKSALPENAVVARTGEDEYAVMMPLTSDVMTAIDVGEKVLSVIRTEPFKAWNESFQIRASVGVTTYPDDDNDPDMVLKKADIALNRAKEDGRDTIKEYTSDFDKVVQQRFQMLRDLRDALEHDELELHFQPQFDLRNGKIIGAEALLRWFKKDNSKEGGSFISPGIFVPIAEQSGLIVPIGDWVLKKACEQAARWIKETGQDIRIAVNVSGAQFQQSDLVAQTKKTLIETGLPAHLLELEVTESAFMEDIEHTIETLQRLHALGVELAIDDFGTGYSSLAYLRQFPIDRLKIDQSFIRNALNDANDASIAKTIIALGRALNLKVIAEGVETKDHEAFLLDEGCDEVQGFRYSKPVRYSDFVAFATGYNGKLDSFD